jgi:hypothetical protein
LHPQILRRSHIELQTLRTYDDFSRCVGTVRTGPLLEGSISKCPPTGEFVMNPSQVRRQILDEHERLRDQLDTLHTAVSALFGDGEVLGDGEQLANLAAIARRVFMSLVLHTKLEDAIVAPALRDIDAWGPIRANTLLEHHAQQRGQLASMLEAYETNAEPLRLARATLDWIEEVRLDMQHEEREMLNSNLLRDDLIAVDMECG